MIDIKGIMWGRMATERFGMRLETLERDINEIRQLGREIGENRKGEERLSLGGTARWMQLQPSSAWPRATVSAFQYFSWCALTKPKVSHFLRRIYSLSKEETFWSLLMLLLTLVFWLFDLENIRRHIGCNKWWRCLQLMFQEGWRGLHNSLDEQSL